MNKITTRIKNKINTDYETGNIFMSDNTLFFDIETTGFSAKITSVYLIGAAYICDSSDTFTEYEIIQWFCDSPADEAIVIAEFFEFMKNFKTLVHYNGEGFDMPYLLYKCKAYNLPYSFDNIDSIDLLKRTRKMEKFLKLENLKQKTIEKFLSVSRDDKYSGGELINIYHDYVKTNSSQDRDLLMLHNFDDVCNLIQISAITEYEQLINGGYDIVNLEIVAKDSKKDDNRLDAIFTARLKNSVPQHVSYGNSTFYMTAYNDTLKLKVNVYTSELKFFFQNYKDYYYLPYEDKVVHKSVAFYVDKDYRTRAKAANCYSKKTGTFLPQKEPVIEPYFKIDYYDKDSYFELEDSFKESADKQKAYVIGAIKWLLDV